jgi:hypothetical protein
LRSQKPKKPATLRLAAARIIDILLLARPEIPRKKGNER